MNKRQTMGRAGMTLGQNMHFALHIFITSVPKDRRHVEFIVNREREEVEADPDAFWGVDGRVANEGDALSAAAAPFDPFDLYEAMMNPKQPIECFGCNLYVHTGRPKWDPIFEDITKHTPETDVGVTFCGNPAVGSALLRTCGKFHKPHPEPGKRRLCFHMHKEVF